MPHIEDLEELYLRDVVINDDDLHVGKAIQLDYRGDPMWTVLLVDKDSDVWIATADDYNQLYLVEKTGLDWLERDRAKWNKVWRRCWTLVTCNEWPDIQAAALNTQPYSWFFTI